MLILEQFEYPHTSSAALGGTGAPWPLRDRESSLFVLGAWRAILSAAATEALPARGHPNRSKLEHLQSIDAHIGSVNKKPRKARFGVLGRAGSYQNFHHGSVFTGPPLKNALLGKFCLSTRSASSRNSGRFKAL